MAASSSSSSAGSSSLALNMDLLRAYYAQQDTVTHDEMESDSITPRAIVDGHRGTGIRKYQSVCESSQVPSTVTRYVIDLQPDHHEKEKAVFKRALDHLKQPTISPYGTPGAENVVLVDFFVWKKSEDSVDEEDGKLKYHTVCLCKTGDCEVRVIDSFDIKETAAQIIGLVEAVAKGVKVIPETFGKHSRAPVKFYAPPNGLLSTPNIGRDEGERRDCIDVAVKVAFVLVEAQRDGKDLDTALSEVSGLSNQDVNDPLKKMEGSALKGTLIRGLQCSDARVRELVTHLFRESWDVYKHIAPLTHNDLEVIRDREEYYGTLTSGVKVNWKNVGGLSLQGFKKLKDLANILRDFTKENCFEVSVTIGQAIDIGEFILQPDRGWTELHLAIIDRKGKDAVNAVLEKYRKLSKEKKQKLIGWPDIYGQTALHWAADRAAPEVLEAIYDEINEGQICYQTYDRQNTALHLAVHANKPDNVKILLGISDKEEPPEMTKKERKEFEEQQKKREKVRKLLPELADNYGQTPLHWAADSGFVEICELLYPTMTVDRICQQTNDPDQKRTALHFAVYRGHREVVGVLLDRPEVKERLLDIRDSKDRTARDLAQQDSEIFRILS